MSIEKTLIIFDTNKARNVLGNAPRYDTFEFGKEFIKLQSFIKENSLSSYIIIAITEMTLKELVSQKKKSYDEDIKHLPLILSRLQELENVNIQGLTLPNKDFNCIEYLTPKIKNFLKDNEVYLIRLKNDKKVQVFDNLIEKVIDVTPPFQQNKDKSCNGVGFKDAVIWETIKQHEDVCDFSNIVMFSADKHFRGCETEVININLKIIPSTEFLIQELRSIYAQNLLEKKYEKIIQNEYLLENIKQFIADELNYDSTKVNIINLTESIIEDPSDLKNAFSNIGDDEKYFSEKVAFKSKVKVKNRDYLVFSLIDLGSNEIESINYEEN